MGDYVYCFKHCVLLMLQYSVTFSGISGALFRGMLVVSWDDAGARVGTFISGIGTGLTCSDLRVSHLQNMQLLSAVVLYTYVGIWFSTQCVNCAGVNSA